jgi:putative flippase GtrA
MTMISVRSLPTRLEQLVLSPAARPLRFAGTGGVACATQLLLLALLTRHGWDTLPANLIAFLLAAQLNFALSVAFTWRDRRTSGSLLRRWLLYHGSIAAMALLNMLVFIVMRPLVPVLLASALGITIAAVGNYLAGDRLVFRRAPALRNTPHERRSAA